ncbi:MAG: sulfite exporter TauE/SafE family protein [Actinobacteria bacterium]|nr:sulfite exporter TauE/SafE family protein [Actinomycetota bacterium]
MTTYLLLALLGLVVGIFGTLVGAGGGFILTPVLLILYPGQSAATITSISLVVVFFNAASGSVAYARMRRIDYRSGLQFALAALPGSVAGATAVRFVPVRAFDAIMAVVLAASAYAVVRLRPHAERPIPGGETTARHLVDGAGTAYSYRVPVRRGIAYSVGVGFLSSFLGIGGGIIHVPLMVGTLGFPMHVATATSHFVLVFMSGAGSITHLLAGTLSVGHGLRRALALSVGVLPGAQVGAIISRRLAGPTIRRLLGAALIVLAARLLISVFF